MTELGDTAITAGASAGQSRQFATFYVSGLFFGIEVVQVQEVLRRLEMTAVPLAPDVVEGLINLRGQIVTAIDMRKRLGLPTRQDDEKPMNMVIRSDDGAASLLVDEIGDVVEARADSYEPAPENMPKERPEMIDGVYKLEGRLLLLLNSERVLQTQLCASPT